MFLYRRAAIFLSVPEKNGNSRCFQHVASLNSVCFRVLIYIWFSRKWKQVEVLWKKNQARIRICLSDMSIWAGTIKFGTETKIWTSKEAFCYLALNLQKKDFSFGMTWIFSLSNLRFSFHLCWFNQLICFLNLSEVTVSFSAVCLSLWNLQNIKVVSAAELTNKNVSWRIFLPVFQRSVCLEKADEEAMFQTKSRSCKSDHGSVQMGVEVLLTARFFRDPTQEDESWLWNHPDTRVLWVQVQKKIMWNWDSLWTVPCVLIFSLFHVLVLLFHITVTIHLLNK